MRCVSTYVVRAGRSAIGYYALGVETFATHRLPEALGRDAFPRTVSAVILHRLAVDKRHQNMGLGRLLLRDAITRFAKEAENQGGDVLLVQAKNQTVRQLYISCGFNPLPSEDFVLFLTLRDVRKTLEAT